MVKTLDDSISTMNINSAPPNFVNKNGKTGGGGAGTLKESNIPN